MKRIDKLTEIAKDVLTAAKGIVPVIFLNSESGAHACEVVRWAADTCTTKKTHHFTEKGAGLYASAIARRSPGKTTIIRFVKTGKAVKEREQNKAENSNINRGAPDAFQDYEYGRKW